MKLPPINSDISLLSKDTFAKAANRKTVTRQTEMDFSFPQILGSSSVFNPKPEFVVNEQLKGVGTSVHRKISQIETTSFDFLKVYTVLPPINSNKQKGSAGYKTNKQPNCLDGKYAAAPGHANSSIESVLGNGAKNARPTQLRTQKNDHEKTVFRTTENRFSNDNSPKNSHNNRKAISRTKTNNGSLLIKDVTRVSTSTLKVKNSPSTELASEDIQLPQGEITLFSNKKLDVQDDFLSSCEFDDGRYILPQLEISEDLRNFLGSNSSKRREGVCIELDSTLGTAVEYIRDKLLRQTMEELCMMW